MTRAKRYPAKVSFTLALNGKITLLTILVLPLLVSLGYWQLGRATEKRMLLEAYLEQQQRAPLALDSLSREAIDTLPNYTRVSVEGLFDNAHSWLLDNKLRQGRVGYEVVTPFRINADTVILVNRGWVAAGPRRDQLPFIAPINNRLTLFGGIYRPSDNRLLESRPESRSWPQVIVELGHDTAERALEKTLSIVQLRLDEASPGAFVTDWATINISPEKHTGYAIQWFVMAIALVLWFICANTNIVTIIKAVGKTPGED